MKKKLSLNQKIIVAYLVIAAVFSASHITPTIAIKTNLLTSGYFTEAAQSQVTEKNETTQEGEQLYTVTPAPRFMGTAREMSTYRVERFLFLYFGSYHGEV